MGRWAEVAVALALSALVVVLSLRFSTHGGPLWRDEVTTVNLANEPTYAALVGRLHLDSAPALYPTVVRAWFALGWRDEDAALRDLIARHLERAARAGDLVVISPWQAGITFARYYRGEVPWVTLPPIEDHTIHRYDLVKQRMLSPDPLAPLYAAIGEALRSGHRGWLVGSLHFVPRGQVPAALPRPGGTTGWSDDFYSPAWPVHAGYFIQTRAVRWEIVTIAADQPVNPLENLPLLVVEGWAPRS